MEGVEYKAEVTLKNVPQDYKSSGAGFGGEGYDAGGKLLLGGNVLGTLKDDGRGNTSVGWAGAGVSIGISGGTSADKTNTKFIENKK